MKNPETIISKCGVYRYFLSRNWIGGDKKICFIGLNPSTADAHQDDPTIRRCINFSKQLDGDFLMMVNIFALRSSDPKALSSIKNPLDAENIYWLEYALSKSDIIIAAWGNNQLASSYAKFIIPKSYHTNLFCLDHNKNHSPKHPLYIKKNTAIKKYNMD